jgi:hypothetical protein
VTDTTISDAKQAAATEPSATEPATPAVPRTTKPATDKTAPPPGPEQDPPTEDQKAEAPPKPDPRDLAIRRLAFEQRETRRQLKEAQERLAQAQPKDPNAPPSQADIDRQVEERAQAIIERREQAARDEEWQASGQSAYPDFTERCNILADIGAGENPAFMAAIRRLPEGQKVIAELAENPAEATRILKLSPVDLALELAGISNRIAAPEPAAPVLEPKPTTKAPPPIRPIAPAARAEPDPSRMSSEEYQKWWNKRTRGG